MNQPYRLQIGDITCHVLPDGYKNISFDALETRFPNANPIELKETAARFNPAGSVVWSFNPLLIQSGDQVVLVDTGMADTSELVESLVGRDAVTTLLISHTHGDHVKGAADDQGNLTYPNARIVMQTAEWEWWKAEGPLRDAIASRLECVDGEVEIADGVKLVAAPGHTPGHVVLMIESKGERFLDLVDTLHANFQMEKTDWCVEFDADMDHATKTRYELLGWAADEALLTLLYHFEFPGLGHIKRAGDNFEWETI